MKRLIYSIWKTFIHRKDLLKIKQGRQSINGVISISKPFLDDKNIDVLVLDFDGVMAPHGEDIPCKEVIDWLNRLLINFDENKVYILSNRPTIERKLFFKEYFPNITFISGVRKKPYPDGLELVAKISGVKNSNIALVDDRLLTGCLSCVIAGSQAIWVTQAYTNFTKSVISESFFKALRWLDKIVIR
jgi:uncharacterized protein